MWSAGSLFYLYMLDYRLSSGGGISYILSPRALASAIRRQCSSRVIRSFSSRSVRLTTIIRVVKVRDVSNDYKFLVRLLIFSSLLTRELRFIPSLLPCNLSQNCVHLLLYYIPGGSEAYGNYLDA